MNSKFYIYILMVIFFQACETKSNETQITPDDENIELRIIKKTGQIHSYDINGSKVVDDSVKDDGYYQTGESPRYTRASDIVSDDITKLMWQDNEDVNSTKRQWLTTKNYKSCKDDSNTTACFDRSGDTAYTFCSSLSLGGYEDWRVPTLIELESILDYSKYPSIDETYFYHIANKSYWSSFNDVEKNYNAWSVGFYGGYESATRKDNSFIYVRCVRELL